MVLGHRGNDMAATKKPKHERKWEPYSAFKVEGVLIAANTATPVLIPKDRAVDDLKTLMDNRRKRDDKV